MSDRLFTPRFFIMCTYSFTVFVSVFQLLPTAPYHIIDLGGSTTAAGLFLGFLTFASAFSAPFTGPLGDRFGQRRVLMVVSLVIAVCVASYAFITSYKVLLCVVIVHGLFWSALLTSSGAYMTATIPAHRRAEGLSYWGLASVLSMAVAPTIGFWVYHSGWHVLIWEIVALNLLMAVIAWRLPDDGVASPHAADVLAPPQSRLSKLAEWRVLLLAICMALVAFGYGSLTSFSALFADHLQVTPRSLFLSVMAAAVLFGRLTIGRTLDRRGHRNVLLPSLMAPAFGLFLLAFAQGKITLVIAAIVFGSGFGLMYPSFTAYVMNHIPANRRGAAFGAILAAFDTGVGAGSTTLGWLVHNFGFRSAYLLTAATAALALPYFLFVEKRLGFRTKT